MQENYFRQKDWFYRYFKNISLHRLNMLSLVFILVFTILFSVLLIHDEYQVFENTIEAKKSQQFEDQRQNVMANAQQFERLFEYVLQQHQADPDEELGRFAQLFGEEAHRFILLFDTGLHPLKSDKTIRDLHAIDFHHPEVFSGVVQIGSEAHPAVLYPYRLKNGYALISGVFSEPYDAIMSEEFGKMKARLIRIILEIVTLAFMLFGFMLGVLHIVNHMLEKDVDSFLKFFEDVKDHYHVMHPMTAFFKEFRIMSGYANTMVDTIMRQKASLRQLNLTLEDKVKAKTALLQVKNQALESEKEFSQQLLESQKQFIRYAIHETNTPLSVIMANIELYEMQEGKNRYLGKIESAVKNIFSIYDDLSYLVKKDQIEYPRQMIELCAYVQSRVTFFDEVARNAGVAFTFSCASQMSYIDFNETKLQRIVDNNLTNAIKYTRTGETIRVRVVQEGNTQLFSVASASSMIEDTRKIFEAFYREKSQDEGFGLGLNLVKSICDEEGVKITIESSEDETTFSYRFAAGVRA